MGAEPQISFVIATYNRRDVVLCTLQRIHCLGMSPADAEIIVVDNASLDGTGEAIKQRYKRVRCIALDENLGSCAKAAGVDEARGRYVVFLDDDSYPRPGSIKRMAYKFELDEQLGAAGFCVHLPDGRQECSALPNVFIGCGVGLRREALTAVGGLDRTLFMQAEEYDLSFRLIDAGWKVETLTDLHVDHLKSPEARLSGRTVYYDTRNNLILTARYLPEPYASIYHADWRQRYGWIAAQAGHGAAYWRGRLSARWQHSRQRRSYAGHRLGPDALEQLFRIRQIEESTSQLRAQGVRRVVLADLGKNIYPFVRAARRKGIEIVCIAADRFADGGRRYRGTPIRTVVEALDQGGDAIVISNTSPVHAQRAHQKLAAMTDTPIHRWFGYDLPTASTTAEEERVPCLLDA